TLDAGTNTLTCDLGDIPSGQSRQVVIKTVVKSNTVASEADGTTLIKNTASVASGSVDPDLSNNSTTESTFVQELAALTVTKICKPDGPLDAGQTGTCTVFVDNLGPSSARDVTVRDAYLANGSFTFGTISSSQ